MRKIRRAVKYRHSEIANENVFYSMNCKHPRFTVFNPNIIERWRAKHVTYVHQLRKIIYIMSYILPLVKPAKYTVAGWTQSVGLSIPETQALARKVIYRLMALPASRISTDQWEQFRRKASLLCERFKRATSPHDLQEYQAQTKSR